MASEDLRLITREELEPVVDILTFLRDAQSLANTLIADTEAEYQHLSEYLNNREWQETGERARRFHYLRWQRVALREFINHQALVTQRLREQAGLEEADLEDLTTSEEEEDVIIADTATAA